MLCLYSLGAQRNIRRGRGCIQKDASLKTVLVALFILVLKEGRSVLVVGKAGVKELEL